MKKWIELIEENRDKILDELKAADEAAYRRPACEYRVYIDTEGDVGHEEWLANDNGWFQFRDGYDRCYIRTFCHQYYDILWDYWFNDADGGRSAFAYRFGYPVEQDEDCEKTAEQEMRDTILAHGGNEADLEAWLEEMTDEAIDQATSECDYDIFIRVRIDQLYDHDFM